MARIFKFSILARLMCVPSGRNSYAYIFSLVHFANDFITELSPSSEKSKIYLHKYMLYIKRSSLMST